MTQTTFEQGQSQVAELVERFSRNAAAYRSPTYNEAQARIEFINPFFEALGWDVHNRAGYAPQYRHVDYEYSVEVEGVKKSPDYAFKVSSRDDKFFAEAKKPGVNIKTNADAAYQVRAYGWNVKLPISLLTDFEEFAVYDCRARPAHTDKPSVGRIQYYVSEEYADRFHDLWDVFSFETVTSGKAGTHEQSADVMVLFESFADCTTRRFSENSLEGNARPTYPPHQLFRPCRRYPPRPHGNARRADAPASQA